VFFVANVFLVAKLPSLAPFEAKFFFRVKNCVGSLVTRVFLVFKVSCDDKISLEDKVT